MAGGESAEKGEQTGVELELSPEEPVRGKRAEPETIEELAKRAALSESVVMSEIESDDFLQAVQDMIDYVQTRAWPELEGDIRMTERTLAEQIEDVTYQRLPQKKLEESLATKRSELEKAQDEYKTVVDALSSVHGGTPDKESIKAQNEFKKWKYGKEEKKAQIQAKIDRIKREVSYAEEKLKQISVKFSKVPNESVYTNAFDALSASVKMYVKKIRSATEAVMKSRKDGPMLKIDKDAFEAAADAIGKAFESVENSLLALLTYQNSTANEKNTIKLYDGSLKIDLKNVENPSDIQTQAGRLAVYERIRMSRYNVVNAAIRDVENIHRESARKITKPISFMSSVDRFDIGLIYALKLSRLGLLLAASHIASRVFENIYTERMSTQEPKMPDLKLVVVAFMVIAVAFDLLVLGVAYFLAKILPSSIDMQLIKDFAVDTLVAHTMAGISLFPLADVIQDKRYFDFQITATRALRLMRQLCFTTAAFHALVPYFYLTGPFYIQYKNAATEDVL